MQGRQCLWLYGVGGKRIPEWFVGRDFEGSLGLIEVKLLHSTLAILWRDKNTIGNVAKYLGATSPKRLNCVWWYLINICGFSAWNLLLVTLLAPTMLNGSYKFLQIMGLSRANTLWPGFEPNAFTVRSLEHYCYTSLLDVVHLWKGVIQFIWKINFNWYLETTVKVVCIFPAVLLWHAVGRWAVKLENTWYSVLKIFHPHIFFFAVLWSNIGTFLTSCCLRVYYLFMRHVEVKRQRKRLRRCKGYWIGETKCIYSTQLSL